MTFCSSVDRNTHTQSFTQNCSLASFPWQRSGVSAWSVSGEGSCLHRHAVDSPTRHMLYIFITMERPQAMLTLQRRCTAIIGALLDTVLPLFSDVHKTSETMGPLIIKVDICCCWCVMHCLYYPHNKASN